MIVLAPELYLPFRRLGAEYHASADGLAVADRLFALLDAPAAVGAGGALPAPSPARVTVALERVSFSYPARPGLVLDGFDLDLSPGETVALIGESGAGKSTVAALLLGLLSPTGGRITVGDADLSECGLDAWRRHDRLGAAAPDAVSRHRRREHPPRRPRGERGVGRARRDARGRG